MGYRQSVATESHHGHLVKGTDYKKTYKNQSGYLFHEGQSCRYHDS